MKVTVVGSHLCPDTLYALNKLKPKQILNLRIFLHLCQI